MFLLIIKSVFFMKSTFKDRYFFEIKIYFFQFVDVIEKCRIFAPANLG